MGSISPHEKGKFWGERIVHCKVEDLLPWALQKQLNRSICHMGCELRWAEGSISSIIFARWHQCAHMGKHNSATWRIRPNRAQMSNFWRFLWVPHFQRAACSTFQTCILNSHQGHTMCGSMVDIQSATAQIRQGIKKKGRNHRAIINQWWPQNVYPNLLQTN